MRSRVHAPREIEQQQAVPAGDAVVRLGVRIGGVRINRHDPARLDEPLLGHAQLGEIAQLPLGGRGAGAHAPRRLLRGRFLRLRHQLRRDCLRRQFLRREDAFDPGDELGAGDDFRTHPPHQLHGARVDARHGRDLVSRGVLHRHATGAAQDATQLAIANAPRRVRRHGPRNPVERVRLDRMHELLRLSACRPEAVPAPSSFCCCNADWIRASWSGVKPDAMPAPGDCEAGGVA